MLGETGDGAAGVPTDAPFERVWEMPVPRPGMSVFEKISWLIAPRRPIEVLEWGDRPSSPVADQSYDLIWYFRAVAYALAPNIQAQARIVDLDDLEDQKLRGRRGTARRQEPLKRRVAQARNAVGWRRYQESVASAVDLVTVCSEVDLRRLAAHNCTVVPNGFPHADPLPHGSGHPPTVLLIGLFVYEPNADAAEHLVTDVLPELKGMVPDVRVRLVGRPTPRIERLDGPDVAVLGEVEDLAAEYAQADVVIAPVRFGSGTRVKIIEAFARGVPVVATPLASEGLDAQPEEHLLTGATPSELAVACARLLTDPALGRRLVENAFALYESRYDERAVARAVDAAVEIVLAPSQAGDAGP
jgi:glycosyltransferase involved in cell wall biosynthesis